MRVSAVIDRFLNLLFPPRCFGCSELLPYYSESALCEECEFAWRSEKTQLCPDCGKKHIKCRCKPHILSGYVNTALHLVQYTKQESVARRLILTIKDGNYKYLYGFLADELCDLIRRAIKDHGDYVITYVPRSAHKKRIHGVDQAQVLAKAVAKRLGVKCVNAFSSHQRREQKKLVGADRLENAVSSYTFRDKAFLDVCSRKVILIDDVITTAASAYACSSLLNQNGAQKTVVVTVGKTYKEKRYAEALGQRQQ